MVKSTIAPPIIRAIEQLFLNGGLIVLLGLFLTATALAGPPEPAYEGPETCAKCHQEESEAWQDSAHAKAMAAFDQVHDVSCAEADEDCRDCLRCHTTDFDPVAGTFTYGGVTCEACHGPYVADHPQDGPMQLAVDSSVCRDCHLETYQQWEDSLHAQAGVQCIGCHLSHSQDFRLTDEALCGACHRDRLEDFAHTAHSNAGTTCVDCHVSSVAAQHPAGGADLKDTIGSGAAPSHSFMVASAVCVECHGQGIHEEDLRAPESQVRNVRLLAMAESAPQLAAKLKTVEQVNKSLQTMTFISLGLGLGIGGMLGIIFILVVGYVIQGRARK